MHLGPLPLCRGSAAGGGAVSDATDTVRDDLAAAGLAGVGEIHRNLPYAELVARSLARKEGILASNGALVVHTGLRTGRSPHDRFIVDSKAVHDTVDWGAVNKPCSRRVFDHLLDKASAFLQHRESFIFDGYAGADPGYRQPIRVVAEATWHALFAHTLFLQPTSVELRERFAPAITVIDCGALTASPKVDGARSEAFVGIDFERRLVLIVGTMYAGEIKKSVFTMLNYLLPRARRAAHALLGQHRARRRRGALLRLLGHRQDDAVGRPRRRLIGDDEHGWSDDGVFNFEGGCYAKVIRLSPRPSRRSCGAVALRHGPRERGLRPGDAQPRPTTTTASPRTRGPPTRWTSSTNASCRAPAAIPKQHHLPDLRRLRRAAADRQAHARAGDVPLPLGLHLEAWPAPRRA